MDDKPKWKYLVAVSGKGTPKEERIRTKVKLYWSETLKRWVSIPERD